MKPSSFINISAVIVLAVGLLISVLIWQVRPQLVDFNNLFRHTERVVGVIVRCI